MSNSAPLRLAVVGSGPAGCYLAQSMLRGAPEAEITVFDRLPCPYGLIRYGVAADHQHTKAITRQFERLFQDPRVTFAGNVDVGADIDLDALGKAFDAVVLATGLVADRGLDLPGGDLPGVFGAGGIVRTLNSHPEGDPALPDLGSDVVIVGGGNVAIDILRFLVKGAEGYGGSDVADAALAAYLEHPALRVTLLNRSSPAEAKSDPQMLKELAALPRAAYAAPELAASETPDDRVAKARLAALAELADPARPAGPGPEVALRFGAVPLRILGDDRVEGVEFAVDGRIEVAPATSVITAIGFRPEPDVLSRLLDDHGLPAQATTGRVAPGVYRTGWAKRGPSGAIPENRACAKEVADEMLLDLAAGSLRATGAPGLAGLPEAVRERAISYDQWMNLERHERELAPSDRVRRKLTQTEAMLAIARTPQT